MTTYSNIINTARFFTRLESDDQGYLQAALQEEMSHYLLEQSVTDQNTPFTQFYYPVNMFADTQTTLNTLVSLEDAFIAAYLVGVRRFSTPNLRVTSARIMGIGSDHRTLARVVGPGVSPTDGVPIEMITGSRACLRAWTLPTIMVMNEPYACHGLTRPCRHCFPLATSMQRKTRDSTRRSHFLSSRSHRRCPIRWVISFHSTDAEPTTKTP